MKIVKCIKLYTLGDDPVISKDILLNSKETKVLVSLLDPKLELERELYIQDLLDTHPFFQKIFLQGGYIISINMEDFGKSRTSYSILQIFDRKLGRNRVFYILPSNYQTIIKKTNYE